MKKNEELLDNAMKTLTGDIAKKLLEEVGIKNPPADIERDLQSVLLRILKYKAKEGNK